MVPYVMSSALMTVSVLSELPFSLVTSTAKSGISLLGLSS